MEERKSEKKLKIDLKLIKYFYVLLQTNISYFTSFMQRLNNLKIYKFLINIWFLKPNIKKSFYLLLFFNTKFINWE